MLLSIVYCGLNHHTHPKLLWGFPTESYYITLIALKLHGGRNNGVGEAGNRHQRAGPGGLGNVVVDLEGRQNGADANEGNGDERPRVLELKAPVHV